MNEEMSFGRFISEMRIKSSMNKQELAQILGISTAYLSQLERGLKCNPNEQLLLHMVSILNLSTEEKNNMFDLYAKANNTVSPDIAAYINQNKAVSCLIRTAQKYKVTENVWLKFIKELENEH